MQKLETKLEDELVENGIIVACRFPFPNWKPIKTLGVGIDQVWIYQNT